MQILKSLKSLKLSLGNLLMKSGSIPGFFFFSNFPRNPKSITVKVFPLTSFGVTRGFTNEIDFLFSLVNSPETNLSRRLISSSAQNFERFENLQKKWNSLVSSREKVCNAINLRLPEYRLDFPGHHGDPRETSGRESPRNPKKHRESRFP